MSRRSGRLEATSSATVTNEAVDSGKLDAATNGSSAGDQEFGTGAATEDEDVDEEKGKKKKMSAGTKRKRAERKTVPGQPLVKRTRGKRGSLKDLLEMNIDVLYEIFGCLDPLDLLHLARASKMTREFLMSKSSKLLWKAARSNIPGLPECPEDLSEPQYANLAFGKSCHFCLRHLGNLSIVWTARIRICGKCIDEKFRPWSLYSHTVHSDLYHYVPKVLRSLGRGGRHEEYYYYHDLNLQWVKEHSAAEDKKEWVREKVEKLEKIKAHSSACTAWYDNYQKQIEEEKAALVQTRINAMTERLREMGWGAEIDGMRNKGDSNDTLKKYPALVKACQKDLTDRIIQNLLPTLDAFMKEYKEKRLARDREMLIKARILVLTEIVDTYRSTIPPNAVALDIGDIFGHPEVLKLMVSSLEISDPVYLDPIRAKLPEIVQQLHVAIEDRLVKMVEAACGSVHGLDRSTLLNLATTTFRCESCTYTVDPIRYPRVIVHRCATKKHDSVFESHPELQVLATVTGKTPWNRNDRIIKFNGEARKVLSEVITLCGFDPATTTAARMDMADPILECTMCNDPHNGRMTMRWDVVPNHKAECHKAWTKPLRLVVLEEELAKKVRERMDEDRVKKRAASNYSDMVCTYCSQHGNSVSLRKHIKAQHGITKPSEAAGDFMLHLDGRTPLITYRAWPPRDEDEVPIASAAPAS